MIIKDFFIAVATCSAAIIGIMSAFLITHISNKKSSYNRIIERKNNLENNSEFLKLKSNQFNFSFYNRWLIEFALIEISNVELESITIKTIGKYIKTPILITESELSTQLDKRKINQTINNHDKFITKFFDISNQILNYINDIRYNIKEIKNLNNDIIPFNSDNNFLIFLIILNILLFLIGLIYPLSFIPFDGNYNLDLSLFTIYKNIFSLSGFLLFIISFIYLSIMIYYIFELLKFKLKVLLLIDKQKYSYYSPFLKNLNNI